MGYDIIILSARLRSGYGLAVAATNRVPRGAVPRDPVPPGSSHPCTIAFVAMPRIYSPFCWFIVVVVVVNATLGSGIPSPPLCCCCRVHCGFEGSHPFACIRRQARSFSSVAGGRCRSPPSAFIEHAPPPLEVLLPHSPPSLDARLRRGHCGSGGHNSPPPLCAASVLGAGMAR